MKCLAEPLKSTLLIFIHWNIGLWFPPTKGMIVRDGQWILRMDANGGSLSIVESLRIGRVWQNCFQSMMDASMVEG
jgi:hypothetical protein